MENDLVPAARPSQTPAEEKESQMGRDNLVNLLGAAITLGTIVVTIAAIVHLAV